MLDGNRRFTDRAQTLQKRSLKGTHTSWLAEAVHPDYDPRAQIERLRPKLKRNWPKKTTSGVTEGHYEVSCEIVGVR